jgi:hypothetical protein
MNNQDIAHNVRGWVHYDTMCATLQKQILNARKQRDAFEEQVGILLKNNQMPNAIIQISGGQLQFQEEKCTSGLTMKSLQDSIELYFKSHPELPNKTNELVTFIRDKRTVTSAVKLKKLKAPAQPAQGILPPVN